MKPEPVDLRVLCEDAIARLREIRLLDDREVVVSGESRPTRCRVAAPGSSCGSPGCSRRRKTALFLDEIGELPLPVQVKLNRALHEKEIEEIQRIGDKAD